MGFDRCGEFSFSSGIMIYRLSGLAPGKQHSHPLPIFLFVLPPRDGRNSEYKWRAEEIPPFSDIWHYKEERLNFIWNGSAIHFKYTKVHWWKSKRFVWHAKTWRVEHWSVLKIICVSLSEVLEQGWLVKTLCLITWIVLILHSKLKCFANFAAFMFVH